MNDMNFVDRVKKYLSYLESEFSFKISIANNSQVRAQSDGMVKYSSATTVILIDSETGYVTIRFSRAIDGEKYYLTPIDVHEYLNTNDSEKKLLLSTNPADQSAAAALFNQKFLLNQPGWKGSQGSVQDLERELRNFSNWLKQHANLCLKGDFSQWATIYEYKIHRARADHLRRGKNELGLARVKDANGNWKLVQQSIFKDKLEHIEKLKQEFPE